MSNGAGHVADSVRALDSARVQSRAVQIWAFFGAALLILQLYVWFQWITGPYLVPVPTGPSDPPMYMKLFLGANLTVLLCGFPFAIWWFWIRPWRKERRITLDGM